MSTSQVLASEQGPPLFVSRTANPLDGGPFLHLPHAHRSRVLVAVAFLDGHFARRPAPFPASCTPGRALDFRGRHMVDV